MQIHNFTLTMEAYLDRTTKKIQKLWKAFTMTVNHIITVYYLDQKI